MGKVAIVTGANSGIGYETAKDFAERGARVILGCRSEVRGMSARDKIVALTGNTDVHFRKIDMSSLKSVREFAEDIIKTDERLDILVNNAGVLESEFKKTEDGLLDVMQINHFGPFLLTTLLLPILKLSASSRIINVSSMCHKHGQIDLQDLNMEKATKNTCKMYQLYANTKLCNVLMTVELERQLRGTGVTANCLHPGAVRTEMLKSRNVLAKIIISLMQLFIKTPWEGAQTTIFLSVSPQVAGVSGRYFSDCCEQSSRKAHDTEMARKLWQASEELVTQK